VAGDRTLADPTAQRVLDANGYAVLPGVARDDVAWLRELAVADLGRERPFQDWRHPIEPGPWQQRRSPGDGWRIGVDEKPVEQREDLEARLRAFWEPFVDRHLHEQRHVYSSFLAKGPGPESFLPLHMDPTCVDETRHRSITVWVALDDISRRRRNGPMQALRGSHVVGNEMRGTGLDPTYLEDVHQVWPCTHRIDVRAGDVVILEARLLHGSPPNRAATARHALAAVVVPQEVQLIHAVAGVGDDILVLEVDDEFYRTSSPRSLWMDPPRDRPVVEVVQRRDHRTTTDDLLRHARRRPVLQRAQARIQSR
jgi:hypothetical protein